MSEEKNGSRNNHVVRVNSKKGLRSLKYHRLPTVTVEDSVVSAHTTVISQALANNSKSTSRKNFYDSFSLLLMKLRGNRVNNNRLDDFGYSDEHGELGKVQYNELLWLELQAWHSGRTLEEADSELQEERNRTVDAVIREVKNFKFTTEERNGSISEEEKQSVCQKLSSSSRSSVCSYCEDPDDDMTSPLVKGVFDKEMQIEALREVVELLKEVDHAEQLYCSLATLTIENNRYKDVMFRRNYKALVLWLNINKDIFHTMYMLADWIDLDFSDQLLWKDWFSNGLDLTCIRTNHSFKNRVGCTGEMVDALANFSSLLPIQLKTRRSKLLRKSNRNSTFNSSKITSTSRYRWFVESEMRKTGLFDLMKRIQNILCGTLTKVLYTLTPCEKSIFNELKECDSQLHKAFQNMSTDDAFPKSFDIDKEFIRNKMLGEGSQFGKACDEMRLPSVIEPYLFLAQVQLDIILECIRFRLEYKPKVELSHLSLKQLIRECKELICGGVLAKHAFVNSVTPLFQEISGLHREHLQKKVKTFEEDLKSILNVYLDYLDRWYSLVCVMERAGEYLKGMDQEWVFVKNISVFVPGGAAKAAQKFCMIASNLLQSSGDFLKYSIDKCFTAYRKGVETESTPHKISVVCRKYKKIVSNMQVRVSKGLGFAKMLRKDLGVASKYTMISGSLENIFRKLKDTNHVKLDVELSVEYWIFASSKLYSSNNCKSYKMCLSLVFGEEVSSTTGYILLIKKPSTRIFWKGVRKNIDVCDKLQHALNNIEVESMVCVCTSLERNQIASMLEGCVKCVDEQTASHFNLQQALLHLNTTAKELADVIVTPTYHLDHNIMPALHRLDKDEKGHLKKICTETMNQYYSLCFEYLRETVRLYTGSMRKEMSVYFLRLSKLWIKFVTTYTSKGRGSRPRWAAQGMEFLMVTIEPIVLNQITEKEFQELKEEMQYCIAHIIGTPKPSKKYKIKGHKRSRSTTFSPPKPVNGLLSHTTSVPNLHSEEGLNSLETSFDNLDIEDEYPTVVRVRSAIQEIEERRTAKLQYMGVIGSVTSQKPSLASELVINVRRVNFKWQLGSKIGEGQFGKVFSSVNLDTGERMAMKQIRFNPNDYGTIQSIADEITNIQSVQHDTLVKYFGVEVHKDEMLIFMEYCADGTLADISRLGLPEPMIRVYTAQIVQAINFLHDNGIIHRDIKGANIFISQSGLIKIGDFGSAVKLKDAVETSFGEVLNTRGTAAYMAPEVITLDKGQGYGRAADIWSLGCVVVEMVTGKHPWAETDNIYAIMFKVGTGQHPDYPKTFCDEGQNFLVNCFIPDPRHRWTATMLIDHPFVKVNQYFEHPI